MLQIGLVFGVCLLGQIVSVLLPVPIPGSVISMVLLFLLLFFKAVHVDRIRQKADFLLKNMAFFFVPAGVGIISQFSEIRAHLLALLGVVVLTTFFTFGSTALTVRGVMKLQELGRSRKRKPRPLA